MSGTAERARDGFSVEVVAGDRHGQQVVTVQAVDGDTVIDAWRRSGLVCGPEPGVTPEFAIFGARAAGDAVLRRGDRVEVLRPLQVDPREARRRRAALKERS